MPGVFKKPQVTVGESPYDAYLANLLGDIQARGKTYADALRPYLAELQARPDRQYLASYQGQFAPFKQQYLDIAKNPIDDALTQDIQSRYERSLGNSLAAQGTLGQGAGAQGVSNGMRDFFLDLRRNADSRRAAALSSAEGIEGNIRDLDIGGRERNMASIDKLGSWEQALMGAAIPGYENLATRDTQRRLYNEALTQAGKAPYQEVNDTIGQNVAIAGGIMGMAGGGAGGGGGGGMQSKQENVPATPTLGTQSQGGYSLYGTGEGGGFNYNQGPNGQPGNGGMTPWGTPYSTGGYNLGASGYGDYGPYGGAYSRNTPRVYG